MMSNSWKRPPSRIVRNPPDEALLDEESRNAWTQSMSIRPFGETYLVDCHEGGTHVVLLQESNCSCGESNPGDPCRHVRRVAIEINIGRLPPPSAERVPCQGCETEMPVGARDDPPYLCQDCRLEPGSVVLDEQGDPETPLLVVSYPGGAAHDVAVPTENCTVADYAGNEKYPSTAPVVEAISPYAVSLSRPPRRYLYPVARLKKAHTDDQSPLLPPQW